MVCLRDAVAAAVGFERERLFLRFFKDPTGQKDKLLFGQDVASVMLRLGDNILLLSKNRIEVLLRFKQSDLLLTKGRGAKHALQVWRPVPVFDEETRRAVADRPDEQLSRRANTDSGICQ